MADIVLTTLNARFAHASFGLRYLFANLKGLQARAQIAEFTTADRPVDIVEQILRLEPRIVGIGVYIWNVDQSRELVGLLKRIQPELIVILGGPEVSFEIDEQEICALADYVITGEADLTFAEICSDLLEGTKPVAKVIAARLPAAEELVLPYTLYDAMDVAHRVIYVEASRGCPFRCEFCLSSLAKGVRKFALEPFLNELDALFLRGVRHFKFVDRTFNLDASMSTAILRFFLARYVPELFVHFEMVPDRLPDELREVIAKFAPGALQFEVGIQTFNEDVARLISRRQDYGKLADNFRFLREHTGVHLHADLIAGLPGEDLVSFATGFDRLVALAPQEIQVGILKRLRGTPIVRHDEAWEMVYSPFAPYEILRTKLIDFDTMQRIRRFARYWDMVANSGNFSATTPLIWGENSPFFGFLAWSDWLFAKTAKTHAIALKRLVEFLFEYLTEQRGLAADEVALVLLTDYQQGGLRKDVPPFLLPYLPEGIERLSQQTSRGLPARQARHLAASRAEQGP
ncbi:MAG: B12-binding domain-containing radical SAM protein [Bradymonadaceae bacterium]|nr:B12-binding domain-containing radical SAM protein [Lujinxingiaceae bacterium]